MSEYVSTVEYQVIGMDCAHDAAEIEKAARAVGGVSPSRRFAHSSRFEAVLAAHGYSPATSASVSSSQTR